MRKNDSGSVGKAFQLRYKVFNSENVLLTHIIQARLSLQKQEHEMDGAMCQVCDREDAVKYCPKCEKYMCRECDEDVHDGGSNDVDAVMNESPAAKKMLEIM